jgi:hypothetical protein
MLPLGGLHVKHAVQRGIWVLTQHLFWDQDLPDANWLLASSPALNTRVLTLVPICAVASLKKFTSFLQIFLCVYNLDKHQTVYNTCGKINAYVNKYAYKYTYICICDALIIGKFGKIGCFTRLLLIQFYTAKVRLASWIELNWIERWTFMLQIHPREKVLGKLCLEINEKLVKPLFVYR